MVSQLEATSAEVKTKLSEATAATAENWDQVRDELEAALAQLARSAQDVAARLDE
jgi:hypothetical protein